MAEFDIDRFVSLSKAVDLSDIDWAEARRVGVTDEEERILRYMQDTESHTIHYLHDLLSGHTASDPEVTTFLACWVYEEMHHGRALDRFLVEVGRPSARDRYAEVHARPSARELATKWVGRAAANATPHFAAVHMCWGAVNEFLAAMAYTQLAYKTENRPLQTLVLKLAKDERRHFAFYHHQADKRLRRGGRLTQMVCARLLEFWEPVGIGVADPGVVDLFQSLLFSDRRGRREIDRMHEAVRQLPGMERWSVGYRWAKEALARFEVSSPEAYARHRAADALRDASAEPLAAAS